MCRNMRCGSCKETTTVCPSTRNFGKGLSILNEKLLLLKLAVLVPIFLKKKVKLFGTKKIIKMVENYYVK